MKRTKSMFYNPTTASRELALFANNTAEIYGIIESVEKNLERKITKGIYNSDKAIDAFYVVAENASPIYFKYFGYKFTVNERFNAAIELRNAFEIDHDI